MKRFIPIMVALAILLWLPAGAMAYDITYFNATQTCIWKAEAGGSSATAGYWDFPEGYPADPASGLFHYAQLTGTATGSDGLSTATSTWYIKVTPVESQPLAGGGKDTSFKVTVGFNGQLDLQSFIRGVAGTSASSMVWFKVGPREDTTCAPQLKVDVSWGTAFDYYYGLSTTVQWYGKASPSPFDSHLVWVTDEGGYMVDATELTNTQTMPNVDVFLANPDYYWCAYLYLYDYIDETAGASGLDYLTNPEVYATFHIIEPCYDDPDFDPVPVPPSVILLGSGLVTLALARRRQRG